MDLGLEGRSIVVTGAGSNIGRAIALLLAAERASVTLADVDEEQTRIVASEAEDQGGTATQFVRADVTKRDEVEILFAAAAARFGRVDILVNCAGWGSPVAPFTDTLPDLWAKLIDINFVSVLNCTSAALQRMVPQRQGAIVTVSSDASRQGESGSAVYGGVKAAVNNFMKSVAKENGRHGIRCNVVCPGLTLPAHPSDVGRNSMWRERGAPFTDEQLQSAARAVPLRKLGRPIDVAHAVAFLASDVVAGHITGQVVSVSGGYSMVG